MIWRRAPKKGMNLARPATSGTADRATEARYRFVRGLSGKLASRLSDGDATAQSMPDASPAKWHLAHTSWFFEAFVLRDFVVGYRPFDDRFAFLFNSYYEAEGPRHARARRGLLTRPLLDDVIAYRAHVDAALLDALPRLGEDGRRLIALGLHHEQQHQELMLTDMLHLFAQNPLQIGLWPRERRDAALSSPPLAWHEGPCGVTRIGHDGPGFAFDCEGPRHDVLLHPHALADRLITNGEWIAFMEDGGYDDPSHWLSDGWAWRQQEGVDAPLYWDRNDAEEWTRFTLSGREPVDWAEPVTHVSFYEADAFARWAGARLPTEEEWEASATSNPIYGTFLDDAVPCRPAPAPPGAGVRQMFGDAWEWTGSAYRPYPGYRPAPGAVGEYNGKFMSGQFVLRGGSCATPRGHVRASYRNFFYPHQRWQFTGVRLARDIPA